MHAPRLFMRAAAPSPDTAGIGRPGDNTLGKEPDNEGCELAAEREAVEASTAQIQAQLEVGGTGGAGDVGRCFAPRSEIIPLATPHSCPRMSLTPLGTRHLRRPSRQ